MAGKLRPEESYLEKMSDMETLGILEEIQTLVSDKLQVVSYKWLSRNFLVSSNIAKRLLEEFVEKHGDGIEVVYTLSGWSKSSPQSYHIKLVVGPKLTEAKQKFDGKCSVQVYSVQACIPKDPAALWNAEFIQAEELSKESSNVDNCLRDNRFCGIPNSFVKRNVDGTPVGIPAVEPKTAGVSGPSKSNYTQTNVDLSFQKNKVEQSSSKVAVQTSGVGKDLKSDNQATNVSADKGKTSNFPSDRKGQVDKSPSGSAGSLANLWDHASSKSKPSSAPADLPINDCELVEEGGAIEDAHGVNFKRVSNGEGNRKRRVILDLSDEDEFEDTVSLASSTPPKQLSVLETKENFKKLALEKADMIGNKRRGSVSDIKEEKTTTRELNKLLKEETSVASKTTNGKRSIPTANEIENGTNKKDEVKVAAPSSPKRKKVLKTCIDERGREVTEVVWEGEAAVKKVENGTTVKVESNAAANTISRPPVAKKTPAIASSAPNPGSKVANKKAGKAKDPKQGNIMSFFKKV